MVVNILFIHHLSVLSSHSCAASVYLYNTFWIVISLILLDLERLISRLIIDGYLKQEFFEQHSSSVTAYLRPGINAIQLISSNSQRSTNPTKIQIELIIRSEQVNNNNTDEEISNLKQKSIEQINEQCFDELKKELKVIFDTSNYSNIISEETIKELVKLMP